MRPPLSIGFKMPRNLHPGRRHIGACNRRAGVRGSFIHRRPIGGSRSESRGRAVGVAFKLGSRAAFVSYLIKGPAGGIAERWHLNGARPDPETGARTATG
jgi:hypothetical protein